MALIETDLLLALASITDKHHDEAVKIFKSGEPLKLSPYAFTELDLLILSGKLKVKIPAFFRSLSEVISYYGLEVPTPSFEHMLKAWKLREQYHLTYFDSLHASTAIIEDEPLVSYDKTYSTIKELKYLAPTQLLKLLK